MACFNQYYNQIQLTKRIPASIFVGALITCSAVPAIAVQPETSTPLVVGIRRDLPPCPEMNDSGYQGFALDIWGNIANKHSLSYELKPFSTVEGLISASTVNDADLVVSCHIVTAERASRVDFSIPIGYSSIAITSKQKGNQSLQFASRLLTNQRAIRSLLILLLVTFLVAFLNKRQAKAGLNLGRIWTILILGSGVHSLLSNKKRTQLPILAVTALRLILVSIFVGTSASIVFDEDRPMDASKITKKQFMSLLSEGLGVFDETAAEDWSQKKMRDLRISNSFTRIKSYSTESEMLESMKSGDINHAVTYYNRLPYYLHLLNDSSSYHASYIIDANAPMAFVFGSGLDQSLKRVINSELAALNHNGTISRIGKYWASSFD